jgi:SAM-dependent methyltransferase
MMDQNKEYYEYLKTRSSLAYVYRSKWVYPILNRNLHGKVLDVGCGIGDFLSFRPNTIGVDINPETVKHCESIGFNAYLMEENLLPFESKEFDGCVLDNVLEHIAKPEVLLKEIRRVLSPDGVVIIGVPGRSGYKSDPDHKVFYDKNRLITTLDEAGFLKQKIMYLPFTFPLLTRISKNYCMYGIFCRK